VLAERVSIVVLTHNRVHEVLRTLIHLHRLPQVPPIVVVDNGSTDDTAQRIESDFPQVILVRLPANIGAAARNVGARKVTTSFVAFCDDDTWWAPGALEAGCDLLDTYPHVAVLSARVLVGPQEREDPTCAVMANSPLPSANLPGPAIMGFLAGASIFRRQAFLEAGGYNPRLFIGGEETLLTLDLASRGWQLVYAPQLVVHHHPSSVRDSRRRKSLLARNAIWIAWLRRPFASACQETADLLAAARSQGHLLATLWDAARGMPWVWQNRRVIPHHVEALYRWRNRTGC
jgi:GT2 family glycosyltransferase